MPLAAVPRAKAMADKVVALTSNVTFYDWYVTPERATRLKNTSLGKIIVEARDSSNNKITSYNSQATISISSPGTITGGPTTYNFISGVCTIDPNNLLVYDGPADSDPVTITISAPNLEPHIFSPVYFQSSYLDKNICLFGEKKNKIYEIELESDHLLAGNYTIQMLDSKGELLSSGVTTKIFFRINSFTSDDQDNPLRYVGDYYFMPSKHGVAMSVFGFINTGTAACELYDPSPQRPAKSWLFSVRVVKEKKPNLDVLDVPKTGRLAKIPDYSRMLQELNWNGRAHLGVTYETKKSVDPEVCDSPNEPLSSNLSTAGVYYSETRIDIKNDKYIYYLPKNHFSLTGAATRPYNVLVSKSFEDDRILNVFMHQECIKVYEDLDIMLCAPNDYAYINARPAQLSGMNNCEFKITGDLYLHSYVASVVPIVANDGASRYDREGCVSVCEGFFQKCLVMSPPESGLSTNLMDYHTVIPCMVAKTHNDVTDEDIATVAVAITNFGIHPEWRQGKSYYYDRRLLPYSVEPLNCPHGSNVLTITHDQSEVPIGTSEDGGVFVGFEKFNYVNYAAFWSKEFGFATEHPEYNILGNDEPQPIDQWNINTVFRNPMCWSGSTTSNVVKPFGKYSEFPTDYYDTSAGVIALKGNCIDVPKGYSLPLETGLEQGCPGTPEQFWSFGFRLTPKDNRNLNQRYCVIATAIGKDCEGTSTQYKEKNQLATIDQIESVANGRDTVNCDKQFNIESSSITTDDTPVKITNYKVPEEKFVGGRYVALNLRCAPYPGVDYLTLSTTDNETFSWQRDGSSIKLDLYELNRVKERYNSIEFHHFPSDPAHQFEAFETSSLNGASKVQRKICVEDFYSKYKSSNDNVDFFCYSETFRKTELYKNPQKLAMFLRYMFRNTKSKKDPSLYVFNPVRNILEIVSPESVSSGITVISPNYADILKGSVIGDGTIKGPDISDAYCGPNAYRSMYPDATWGAIQVIASLGNKTDSFERGLKDGVTTDIWSQRYHVAYSSGGNSASVPFSIVIDLKQLRTFNMARYYQAFLSGKVTHAALDVSSSGNLETRTSANWTEVHSYSVIANPTESPSETGTVVEFPMTTARYLRIRLYNDGRYGSTDTAIYLFKLFKVTNA